MKGIVSGQRTSMCQSHNTHCQVTATLVINCYTGLERLSPDHSICSNLRNGGMLDVNGCPQQATGNFFLWVATQKSFITAHW